MLADALALPFVDVVCVVAPSPNADVDRWRLAERLAELPRHDFEQRAELEAADLDVLVDIGEDPRILALATVARSGLWRIRLGHEPTKFRDLFQSVVKADVVIERVDEKGAAGFPIYRSVGAVLLSRHAAIARSRIGQTATPALARTLRAIAHGYESVEIRNRVHSRIRTGMNSHSMPGVG